MERQYPRRMKKSAKDIRELHQQAGSNTKATIEANVVPIVRNQTAKKKATKRQTTSTAPPAATNGDKSRAFDPDSIFYATETGAYYVDVGTHYRAYQRKTPVKAGIRRHLERQGTSDNDMNDLLAMHVDNIELDRAADWVGGLAGHRRGLMTHQGKSFLITTEPDIPISEAGECPLHQDIICQAFPNEDARTVFLAWLSDSVHAIRQHTHQPAPMLVMAGQAGAGKSLLAYISKKAMGGRTANPMTAWTGKLPWNDNLLAAELLLIDDSVSSTDPRARKAFGSHFKEAIYAGDVPINTRRKSSIELRPVWRVMVCCNETPENLSVIPPLEDGIEDKIILLKISHIATPMPACTTEEKIAFRRALAAELPAFLHYLESVTVPNHLADSNARSGVTAWKDPELLHAITEISPEKRLENLLSLAMTKGFFPLEPGESKWLTAAEVQSTLQSRDSPTHSQAQGLLSYHAACGTYLSTLRKKESPFVTNSKLVSGITNYRIIRPQ
jgi:hypothetical protein